VASGSQRKLSTAEVARLLGLRESQVRELVCSGLSRPVRTRRGRAYRFSFQDLVVLYAAKRLLDQGVPASRVRRALGALARELPEGRPLSGLRIFADGRRLAVRDRGTAWQPETGQTLLDFGVEEVAQLAAAQREAPVAREAGVARSKTTTRRPPPRPTAGPSRWIPRWWTPG
jgi:excisionase family DNA binding protein